MKVPPAVGPVSILIVAWASACSGDRTSLVWDDSALAGSATSSSDSSEAGSAMLPLGGRSSAAPTDTSSVAGGDIGGRTESLGGAGATGGIEVSEGGAVDVGLGGSARAGGGSAQACPPECCGSMDGARDELDIIADSERGFSGIQGQCGWSYGYFPGGTEPFTLLTTFGTSESGAPVWELSKTHPPWLAVFARAQHPNLNPLGWIVRRWTSSVDGAITVRGHVAMTDPSVTGDGVVASVRVAGEERWQLALGANDAVGKDFVLSAKVEIGTILDFIVAPRHGDGHDTTTFTAAISR